MKEQLRKPVPWAIVSAAALLAALALPSRGFGLLFWTLTGLCCLAAALAGWFGDSAAE